MRYPSITSVSTGLLVGLVAGVLLTGTPAVGINVGINAAQNVPSYRTPRSAYGDGKPDLNGVWQALNSAYWDVEAHASTKRVSISQRMRVEGYMDIYNVMNSDNILQTTNAYGPRWLLPNQIVEGRLFQFGAQLTF